MADRIDPKQLSQRELDDYIDGLSDKGLDDSPEFHRAYTEWERREAAGG